MSKETTPRPFVVFSVLLAVAAVGLMGLSIPKSSFYAPLLVLLAISVVLSENFALEVPGVGSTSISYPLTVAAIVVMGPAAGGMIALLSSVNLSDLRSRRPWPVLLFNASQLLASASAAGLVYLLLGGRLLLSMTPGGVVMTPLVAEDFPWILLPLFACAVVSFLLNDLLVALALNLWKGRRFRDVWIQGIVWMLPTQIALALVGFTIAQVLAVEVLAFLLFVFPLVVARQVYQNYVSLRAAYVDTIKSLVNILEAKDPYTRGHSLRVSEYARELAEHYGLDQREQDLAEKAAVLHDLGKLGIPRAILTKAAGLSDSEAVLMRSHPQAGAEMVARIALLRELEPLIAAHHRHFDGGGYGTDTAAEGIPLISRILSVVDSYDAMTTARSYRPAMSHEAAVAELIRCAGTQFDPDIVRAFIESGIGLVGGGNPTEERLDLSVQALEAGSS